MHRSDEEEYRAVDELLRELDHRPPVVDVRTVIVAARRTRWFVSRPIAAGIALCVVAGAASAAIPSSPVHRALVRVLAAVRSTPTAQPSAGRDTVRVNAGTGIAIVAGVEADIHFRAWQKHGQLTITFSDDPQLSLVPHGGDAAFSVSRGTIAVDNRNSVASFALDVPRTVQRVRVRVDSATVFRKSGATITARAQPDSAGGYTLDLAEPPVPRPPRP